MPREVTHTDKCLTPVGHWASGGSFIPTDLQQKLICQKQNFGSSCVMRFNQVLSQEKGKKTSKAEEQLARNNEWLNIHM